MFQRMESSANRPPTFDRTKERDKFLKKLLLSLKNSVKIFCVILLLSGAAASDQGMVKFTPYSMKFEYMYLSQLVLEILEILE